MTTESTELQPWTPSYSGALVIQDAQDYVAVAERRKLLKDFQKRVKDWFRGTTLQPGPLTRAYQTYQSLIEKEKQALAPAIAEEPILNTALEAYDAARERERRERERVLEEQARREEEDRRLAEAAALETAARRDPALIDDAAAAFEALGEPVTTATVTVPKLTPRISGVTPSFRDHWQAHKDVDVKKVAAGVASGRYPIAYLLPNFSALDKKAQSCAGTEPVDGVRWVNNRVLVSAR